MFVFRYIKGSHKYDPTSVQDCTIRVAQPKRVESSCSFEYHGTTSCHSCWTYLSDSWQSYVCIDVPGDGVSFRHHVTRFHSFDHVWIFFVLALMNSQMNGMSSLSLILEWTFPSIMTVLHALSQHVGIYMMGKTFRANYLMSTTRCTIVLLRNHYANLPACPFHLTCLRSIVNGNISLFISFRVFFSKVGVAFNNCISDDNLVEDLFLSHWH